MQKNNITYNIKIQGLIINKDFTENDNEIIFTAVRKDKRDTCCNHKMHIKDYRYVTITLPSINNKKVELKVKKTKIYLPCMQKK